MTPRPGVAPMPGIDRSVAPTGRRIRPSRASLVALLLLVLPPAVSLGQLAAAGALPVSLPGLPDPGAVTRWGLPLARGLRDGSASLTIGLLLIAAVALPPASPERAGMLEGPRHRAARLAAAFGFLWVACGVVMVVLTYSDVAGVRVASGTGLGGVTSFVTDFDLGRALAASTALSLATTVLAMVARRPGMLGWAAAVAMCSLLPLAVTGHAASAVHHDLAVDAQAVHLVSVSVWVGGLAGLLLLRRRLGPSLPVVVRRYSAVAGFAYPLVALSGVGSALAQLDAWSGLVSPYGALLSTKALALLLLGAAGGVHRRWLLPRLADANRSARAAFSRLAAAEVGLMSLTLGVAAALAVTPHPPEHDGAPFPSMLPEGLGSLTLWRLDTLWASAAVAAIGGYTLAVRRLRGREEKWPVSRTLTWTAGWSVMVVVTSAGPAADGRMAFNPHVAQLSAIALGVPLLLGLGAPATLALRTLASRDDGSRGPREWLLVVAEARALAMLRYPPLATSIVFITLAGLSYGPLLQLTARTHVGEVVVTTHLLLCGYLLASGVIGVVRDRFGSPRRQPAGP